MFDAHLPHRSALRAMLIALGLPIVLFMFLAIRTRQLHSTANPRWAQFAKITGPSAPAVQSPAETSQLPVLADNSDVVQLPRQDSINPDAIDANLQKSQIQKSIEPLKMELDEIRQRLDLLTRFQTEHKEDDARLELQLANLLDVIHVLLSNWPPVNPVPHNDVPSDDNVLNDETEIIAEEPTTAWAPFSIDSLQEIDLRRFLNTFTQLAQTNVLSGPEPQPKIEKPVQIPMTLQHARLDKSLNEPKYFLRRDGNVALICTTDEAVHLKPEHLDRILRANWQNDLYGSDLNQLMPLIIKGLANVSDKQAGDEFANVPNAGAGKISISRRALARAFYECAALSWRSGDQYKARQQVEASLRQNKNDVDAIRLKNEINQVSSQNADR